LEQREVICQANGTALFPHASFAFFVFRFFSLDKIVWEALNIPIDRSVKDESMTEARSGDVKEVIIQESIRLFLSKGYRGTSVKEITEAAGIGRGTLYWYFKSKDEILISIFHKWEEEFVQGLIKAVNNQKGDFIAKYKVFHKYSTEFARDQRDLAIVFNTLLNEIVGMDSEPANVAGKVYKKYWRFLEEMLQNGKREGCVKQDLDPKLYAHVIAASHVGMLVEWFVAGETFSVGPFVRSFRDMILKSVTSG
jgi:AcrR family transcriptional regulator